MRYAISPRSIQGLSPEKNVYIWYDGIDRGGGGVHN